MLKIIISIETERKFITHINNGLKTNLFIVFILLIFI